MSDERHTTLDETHDWASRASLLGAAPEMLAMLKRLEWIIGAPDERWGSRSCPMCGQVRESFAGHSPDCALAALIAKAEGRGE